MHLLEIIFVNLLFLFIRLMPNPLVAAVGRGFGGFLHLLGVRRKVVMTNLKLAFKEEYDEAELKRICKRVYKNTGSVFFEFFMLSKVKPENLGKYVTLHGGEELLKSLEEGKGALLAGSHFGHWELLSAAINSMAVPFWGYAGKQHNPFFDEMINGIRGKFGMKIISKSKNATKEMMRALKKNEVLGILGDLNVPNDSLFVDFFGIQAAMGQGLPIFTVKGERPLFLIHIERRGPLKHEGYITPIPYELTGDEEADTQRVAQLISDGIEANVRKLPDHYFWFNRRFKTRPEGEKEVKLYHKMD